MFFHSGAMCFFDGRRELGPAVCAYSRRLHQPPAELHTMQVIKIAGPADSRVRMTKRQVAGDPISVYSLHI